MLALPDVTLVAVDTRHHAMTALAVADCRAAAQFGDTVLFSDRPLDGVRNVRCVDFPTLSAYSEFTWYGIAPEVKTSHYLYIQYDSGIMDAALWSDEFLDYDYIGAPWQYWMGRNVGCGGFSLRSVRLMRYLSENRAAFPHLVPEDVTLGRRYRPALEAAGWRWPDEDVAMRFSFENAKPTPTSWHFGYHAIWNWPYVLSETQMRERLEIAAGRLDARDLDLMRACFRRLHGREFVI